MNFSGAALIDTLRNSVIGHVTEIGKDAYFESSMPCS